MMSFKGSSLLCLALLLTVCLAVPIEAINITRILDQYPEFGTLNRYLTETKIADQINKRQTITVLAVADSSISSISGKSQDAIKAIIMANVILDYYDEKKLAMSAQRGENQFTTLYQTSGQATENQGFIKVAHIKEGEIAFASAVKGAPFNSTLVKTVFTRPYNISVLQISKPIIPPGIDSKSPLPAAAPAPAKTKKPVAQSPKKAEAPEAETTEAPSEAPAATAPALAPGPGAEEKAADEGDEDDAPAPPGKSSGTQVRLGLVGAVIMGLGLVLVV